MHDVLDPDDGHAGFLDVLHQFHQLQAFSFGEAAGDLVEQQKPRRARQCARQFEPLAAEKIERAGAAIGNGEEAGAFENSPAGIDHLGLALPAAVDGGDQQILEHGDVLERTRNLERAADAGDAAGAWRRRRDIAAVKVDRAAVRREQAGDQIEQRGLAGAVGPDDAERFALGDFKLNAIDGFE